MASDSSPNAVVCVVCTLGCMDRLRIVPTFRSGDDSPSPARSVLCSRGYGLLFNEFEELLSWVGLDFVFA